MGSPVSLPPGAVLDKAALPPGAVLDAPAPTPKSFTDQLGDFGSHAWDMIKGGAQGLMHPIDSISSVLRNTSDSLDKAKEAYKAGDTGAALAHLKDAVPVLGPIAKQMREEGDRGDLGAEAGDLAGFMTLGKAGELLPKVPGVVKGAAEAAPGVATAVGEAAKAGGKDVAIGTGKVAAGTALLKAGGLGESVGGYELAKSGVRQVTGGLKSGYAALRQSLADTAAAKAAEAQPEPPMAGAVPMQGPSAAAPSNATPAPTAIPPTGSVQLPAPDQELFGTLKKPVAAADAPHPEGAYPIPDAERTQPGSVAPKESYQRAAQTVKGRALARYLRLAPDGGITTEEAGRMTPEQWNMAAQAAGVNAPSPASVQVALTELDNLYKAKGSAQIDKAVAEGNTPKANFYVQKAAQESYLSKNPKALAIAQQLAEEMAK
jgi:hypothetical protein